MDAAAELMLLSEADVVVAGASRFASLAAYLCGSCAAVFVLCACPAEKRTLAAACEKGPEAVGGHFLLNALDTDEGLGYLNF